MNENIQKRAKFIQNIYFIVTLVILLIAVFSLLYGIVESKALQGVPVTFLEFLRVLLYYHVLHFVVGIGLLISYLKKKRKKIIELKLIKLIIGIVISPISLFILMAGFLLLGLLSCST